uniref:Protein-tyrosine phosphatase n=1 Tax=Meloidogyne javanica TaxID=6303 RepID=A0A915N5Z2_MELJA
MVDRRASAGNKGRSGRNKQSKQKYDTEGGRRQSSVLKRPSARATSRGGSGGGSGDPRRPSTQSTGSTVSQHATAAQRWFYCSDYVHASKVKGSEFPMICAQGPIDESIANFWTMVVEQNCGVIVQLCQNQEEGREKCADYIPAEPTLYGNATVSVKESTHATVANPSVHRTVLEASLPSGRSVEVVHFLYDGWPDRDVPLSPAAFRQLRGTVQKLAVARKCSVLIHCSAGIGRTGTYAAIEMAYRDLIANDREVQMSTIFQRLRDQRAHAIQTDLQYLFLHRALIDIALEKGRLNRVDKAGGVDAFIKEYEELIKRKREERKELERKHKRRRGRD